MAKSLPLISDDFVRRVTMPKGKEDHTFRDRKLTGFQMRVRLAAGGGLSKVFQVEQELPSIDGIRKRRTIVIGNSAIFTAEQAREEAKAMLRAIENGDDPKAARLAKIEAPRWEKLVEVFDEEYIGEMENPATQKDYRGRIRRTLTPFFKGTKVGDLGPESVEALKKKKKSNPTEANRSLAVLSIMANFAKAKGWHKGDNPCRGIKRYAEAKKDDWFDQIDLPKYLAAMQKRDMEAANELIRFLTITGWRVTEARTLRRDMVDLERMVAHLPKTKTGAQARQLSTDAVDVIARQGRIAGYVFSGKGGRLPVSYLRVNETLKTICREAGIRERAPHALRHNGATWAAIKGATLLQLRDGFGWKGTAMPNRYVEKAEELGRVGAQKAADALNVLGKPTEKPDAEIIPLIPLKTFAA